MSQPEIAFIGAGNMATALILGLLRQGRQAASLMACDPSPEQLERLRAQLPEGCQINLRPHSREIGSAKVVLLAVKPQVMSQVAAEIKPHIGAEALIISIAAGISLSSLESWLGPRAMVRCMPNTPALVQMGASGLYANTQTSAAQKQAAQAILDAVGISLWVDDEKHIDAVTAVSGSGPAYFFLFMEAMIEAGIELGLEPEAARRLTLQTCAGAAALAAQSDEPVAVLRQRVTSPGGTTERAIASFQRDEFQQTVKRALAACAARAAELEANTDSSR